MKLIDKLGSSLNDTLIIDGALKAQEVGKRMQADLKADSLKIEDGKRGKEFKLFFKGGLKHLLNLNKAAMKWSKTNTVIGKGQYITSEGTQVGDNDAEITMVYRKEGFK